MSKYEKQLHQYGALGVELLKRYTPVDTGITADSWRYEVKVEKYTATLSWHNDNLTKWDEPLVYLIISGHATRWGQYVPPNNFVNEALKPLLDELGDYLAEEVTK